MREDLIFHLLREQDLKTRQERDGYRPPSLEEEGFIHCSTGSQVEATANRLFRGERKLLLLVIGVSSLDSDLKYEEVDGESFPHIYGPVNPGAILDKIPLRPDEEGLFEISFKSYD